MGFGWNLYCRQKVYYCFDSDLILCRLKLTWLVLNFASKFACIVCAHCLVYLCLYANRFQIFTECSLTVALHASYCTLSSLIVLREQCIHVNSLCNVMQLFYFVCADAASSCTLEPEGLFVLFFWRYIAPPLILFYFILLLQFVSTIHAHWQFETHDIVDTCIMMEVLFALKWS